jgi:TolB-like protein
MPAGSPDSHPGIGVDPQHEETQSAATQVPPSRRRPLVAVLPFTPAGDDALLRILGDDIADVLRERLAHDPAVQAILISSDFLSKAPPHALELICRELGVGFLVSGKCHGTGGQSSLYIELTDTRDWHIRWAQFYRGTARTLLAPDSAEMSELVASLRHALVEQARHSTH